MYLFKKLLVLEKTRKEKIDSFLLWGTQSKGPVVGKSYQYKDPNYILKFQVRVVDVFLCTSNQKG